MGSLLVHITHGPEAPTRAALGCTVARAAREAGHDVTVFLAGDAAYIMKDAVIENMRGLGTGSLGEAVSALVDAGVPIYVSGMSSAARGVTQEDIDSKNATFAAPAELVEHTFAADRVLVY